MALIPSLGPASARTTALALALLSGSLASATAAEPALPDAIAAPGQTIVLSTHAEGAQVYECKAGPGRQTELACFANRSRP